MYAIVNDRPREAPAPHPVRETTLARGQTLFFEGDPATSFYEIVSGTVRCARLSHDGRRQIFRFAMPGELLGVACVGAYGFSAEAVTEVTARRHHLSGLDAAMAADGDLRRRVVQALRDELATTRSQMMLLGRMSAAERLATFLLDLAERSPGPGGYLDLPMTRGDIADYLGLTVETVSRKFNELHARGLIRLETPTHIRITDQARIEAIADAA
jgi:CRP-like cAMP-binding protein